MSRDSRGTNPNADRVVRSWLHEDRHEDATRVLHTVLDGVGSTPQHRPRWSVGGMLTMNKFVAIGLGTVAVVVALFVGAQLRGTPIPGGPNPTQSAAPSEPHASVAPSISGYGSLPEGPFTLWDAPGDVAITVTIPGPGWFGDEGGGMLVRNPNADPSVNAGLMVFQGPLYVYRDACHWSTTTPDSPTTTMEGMIAALEAQTSRDGGRGHTGWNIGGSFGWGVNLNVPEDAVFKDCDGGQFRYWVGDPLLDTNVRSHQGPGQVDQMWIGEVNGVLVVFDVFFPGPPHEVVDELWIAVDHDATTFEMP